MRAVTARGGRRPSGRRGGLVCRAAFGAALALLLGLVGGVSHARQEKPADKKAEPRYAFSMDGKPWGAVFTWLATNSGKPVIAPVKPTGTFTFISPAKRTYTMPEVIDLINEALLSNSQTQKYYMLNRERTFTVVPADEKIDPADIPPIGVGELETRGRTEMVQLTIRLKAVQAEDVTAEIKRMMGPFGQAAALKTTNSLVLIDTVGNLRRVKVTIDDLEKTEGRQANQLSHKCKWIKAPEAERILRELLLGEGRPGSGGKDKDRAAAPAQPAGKKAVYVTSNERTNTVLVVGPADRIAEAEAILKRIDIQTDPEQKPILGGSPLLKTYVVPSGSAIEVAKMLQDAYKSSSTCRISTAGSKVLVYASAEDQFEIAELIGKSIEAKTGPRTETISVGEVDPVEVAKTITGMLGDPKSGAPFIEAVADKNAVIVRGSAEEIEEVRAIIKVRTGENGGGSARMRVITLDGGNATLLAEELARVLSLMRKNPVEVVSPDRRDKKDDRGKVKEKTDKGGPERLPAPKSDVETRLRTPGEAATVLAVSHRPDDGGGDGALVDPRPARKPARADDRPGSKDKPVRIFASGNRLMIASDDPEALALIGELVNLYTKSPGKGDFQVLKLKSGNATEAAKALDEAFNGTKQGQASPQPVFNPFFGRFGGPAAAAPTAPETNRIRVVAYPATNSVLVRASRLDMLAIRELLYNALDPEESDPRGLVRTYRIAVKYANATDIASWIKDVYKEQTGPNPAAVNPQFGRFGRFGPPPQPAATEAKAVMLTVGVDDHTNSLIVACPESLYKDIKKMVDEVDEASRTVTRTVKVVNVKGIDPDLIQQAVDAIQGRTVRRKSTTTTGSDMGGTPSFLPGGGFQPVFPLVPGVLPGMGGRGPGGRGAGGPGGRGAGGPGGMSDAREPGSGGGSDFFGSRVTDDPQQSSLYDPQQDKPTAVVSAAHAETPAANNGSNRGLSPVRFQAKDKDKDPKTAPIEFGDKGLVVPRGPVNIEPLTELGAVVISGTPADVAAVEEIIRLLSGYRNVSDLKIQLVPLKNGDATQISAYLSEFYRRVIVRPSGTTQATGQRIQGPPGGPVIEQLSSVVLLPYPRFNAILVAAPGSRLEEVLKQIRDLDRAGATTGLTAFPLKKAPAARVAGFINGIFSTRFESASANQVRVSWDDSINTVFVQASPSDLAEIRKLIELVDSTATSAVNELRLVPLRYGLAEEIAGLIQRAIAQGVQQTGAGGQGIVPTLGGAQRQPGAAGLPFPGGAGGGGIPGAGGGIPGAGGGGIPGAGGGIPGAGGGIPGAGGGGIPGAGGGALGGGGGAAVGATGAMTKYTALRFISSLAGGKVVESGFLDDIRLTPDVRTNSILVSAPPKSVELILTLIKALDIPPAARAEINIFTLKRADAAATAATIQQLFLGTGSGPSTAVGGGTTIGIGIGGGGGGGFPGGGGGGFPGGGGGGFPGGGGGGIPGLGGAGAFPGTTGLLGGGGLRPLTLFLGGVAPETTPLIDLRLTIDPRTNSVIVAGSRNDLEVIEALITRLDDADVSPRRSEVYRLQNTTAVDVANALNTFVQQSLQVLRQTGQLGQFQDIEREVVVVPEPITNKLLISATPRYYPDILRLVAELDAELPQVVIQVLIAEVDLNNTDEFGVEIGLQSPVLFQRSIFPAAGLFGAGTSSFTSANATSAVAGTTVPPGVTVSSTINPATALGFNFNNPSLGLGNNPAVGPGVVGFQGLSSLGVGRVSPNNGIGGFVFSAGSDAFNILVRALRSQGRIDVLSRPQVMTLDNQAAQVAVGQSVPTVQGTNITGTGILSTPVVYRDVGVILNVVPKISPDGKVTMRVSPQVSSVSPTPLSLGNGITAPVFNQQIVDTTVIARDGETVAIGGLITRSDAKSENKVPWLGDLPYVGTLFRYRQQVKRKQELLIILTPHIVRNRFEADRILAMEGRRMDWVLGDVIKTQGESGMLPLFPRPPIGAVPPADGPGVHDGAMPGLPLPGEALPSIAPVLPVGPLAPDSPLPPPRPVVPLVPGGGVLPPGTSTPPAPAPSASTPSAEAPPADRPLATVSTLATAVPPPINTQPAGTPPSATPDAAPAANDGKESNRWRLFQRFR